MGGGCVESIHLDQVKNQWWAFVDTVINHNTGKFLYQFTYS
jgi:hypothetical protein